jgi:hypothetical protein
MIQCAWDKKNTQNYNLRNNFGIYLYSGYSLKILILRATARYHIQKLYVPAPRIYRGGTIKRTPSMKSKSQTHCTL